MDDIENDTIKVGDYVIIQRQSFTKLHKIKNDNDTINLGKDKVNLSKIISKTYGSTFQMNILNKGCYILTEVERATSVVKNVPISTCGNDNRNIIDDGKSQKMSKDEIDKMRGEISATDSIVEKLITNSTTFNSKTEYSQEKYMKKKEKKYYEYIQIQKPTVVLLAELYHRKDSSKVLGMRIDDLSQILFYANVNCEGNYLLYESGTCGLPVAAILHRMGAKTDAQLIHMHPGNEPQKQAVHAMNFPKEQSDRSIAVNIYSVLRCYYQTFLPKKTALQDTKTVSSNEFQHTDINNPISESTEPNHLNSGTTSNVQKQDIEHIRMEVSIDSSNVTENKDIIQTDPDIKSAQVDLNPSNNNSSENKEELPSSCNKSKKDDHVSQQIPDQSLTDESNNSLEDCIPAKRPRLDISNLEQTDKKPATSSEKKSWELDNMQACEILQLRVDALIVIAKEDPVNIVEALIDFVKPSSPILIFAEHIEVLSDLYLVLKQRSDITALRLTETFMRKIQVLPERTHPDVAMNHGGYILFGYTVES